MHNTRKKSDRLAIRQSCVQVYKKEEKRKRNRREEEEEKEDQSVSTKEVELRLCEYVLWCMFRYSSAKTSK